MNNIRKAELYRITETNNTFGSTISEDKIADIETNITFRNVNNYNENNQDVIRYDVLGLTIYNGIWSGII